ncbi:MAG: hypothetical protein WCI74_08535 [Actinomycetes bacterium]|nr:hypothetical protein [Actinomycetota bacterium]
MSSSSATNSLRLPLLASGIVGAIFIILGGILGSQGHLADESGAIQGLIAGVLGALVAIGFLGIGQYVLGRVLSGNPQIAMMAALLVYVLQVLVLLILLLALKHATWLDGQWFGFTVFACLIAWTLAMVADYMRNRSFTVVPGSGPGHPDGPVIEPDQGDDSD